MKAALNWMVVLSYTGVCLLGLYWFNQGQYEKCQCTMLMAIALASFRPGKG